MEPWECPRCRTIHAGWVARCDCLPPVVTTTQTDTGPVLNFTVDTEAEDMRRNLEAYDDLLAACQAMVDFFAHCVCTPEKRPCATCQGREAIAKAERGGGDDE